MPLIRDRLETRVQADALLDQRLVGPAAERVHAGEDVGDVLADLVQPQPFAVVPEEAITVLAGEHEDAAAAGAAVRLDDEVGAAHRGVRASRCSAEWESTAA